MLNVFWGKGDMAYPICPICDEPMLPDEYIVKDEDGDDVHFSCWFFANMSEDR